MVVIDPAIETAFDAIEEVEGQITARDIGIALVHDGGNALVPAFGCERARRTPNVGVHGARLRLLARAFARREEANPAAFNAVALDGPAAPVEVMALANVRGDDEGIAQGFRHFNGEFHRLRGGKEIRVRKLLQRLEHFAFALDPDIRCAREKNVHARRRRIAQQAGEADPIDMDRRFRGDALGFEPVLDLGAVENEGRLRRARHACSTSISSTLLKHSGQSTESKPVQSSTKSTLKPTQSQNVQQ
ncbi:hypothetical protein D3C87_1495260 [compost metagenome]